MSPSGVFVAQIGIFRIGHDKILREVRGRERKLGFVCDWKRERRKEINFVETPFKV